VKNLNNFSVLTLQQASIKRINLYPNQLLHVTYEKRGSRFTLSYADLPIFTVERILELRVVVVQIFDPIWVCNFMSLEDAPHARIISLWLGQEHEDH
jgi:hypothetical protein